MVPKSYWMKQTNVLFSTSRGNQLEKQDRARNCHFEESTATGFVLLRYTRNFTFRNPIFNNSEFILVGAPGPCPPCPPACYAPDTYMHTYILTYIHTHIHTLIHTYTHTYIHTYTHTYIHTYIHTHRHT